MNLLILMLESVALYQLNDNYTRQKLERSIPDCVCNEDLNPWDVIDRNAIRFLIEDTLYEYDADGLKVVL
jgi:hypothetical protein